MAKPKVPKKTNGDATLPPVEAASNGTSTMEKKRSARKPAIVKTESRANLVSISLEDEIRKLAYLLSERRGFEPGHEAEDWLIAESEVRERYRQQHSA